MACCVLIAAVIGGAIGLKSWLTLAARRPGQAQNWRLIKPTDPP